MPKKWLKKPSKNNFKSLAQLEMSIKKANSIQEHTAKKVLRKNEAIILPLCENFGVLTNSG